MCFFRWTSIFSSSWVFTSYLFPMCDFDETKQVTLSWSGVNETFFFFLFVHKQKDWWKDWKENNLCSCYFDTYLFLASYSFKTLWRKLYSREKKLWDRKPWQCHSLICHHSRWCEKRKKLLEELVALLFSYCSSVNVVEVVLQFHLCHFLSVMFL